MQNPYEKCPVFETKNFMIRLIRLEDTADLFRCYSDPKAQKLFNADRCNTDFCFKTIDELRSYIACWLKAYENEEFVRFAIVDKSLGRAVGTIEMFGSVGKYRSHLGVLRLDICSEYERVEFLDELFALCVNEFFLLFGADQILTKVIPTASDRIQILLSLGFKPCELPERTHSWILNKVG